MSFFYNGRTYITPGVVSSVDDSGLFDQNPATGQTLAVLGSAGDGQPKVPLQFGSPTDAVSALVSGPLAEIATKLFSPSPDTGAPNRIIFMRVDGATQAALTLDDTDSADSIVLTSKGYGTGANSILVTLAAASGDGLSAPNPNAYLPTVQYGSEVWSQDNVGYNVVQLKAATGITAGVANNIITIKNASTVIGTVDVGTVASVSALVDLLSAIPGVTVSSVMPDSAAVPRLDPIDDTAITTTGLYLYANRSALVDWFSSAPGIPVTATLSSGDPGIPALISHAALSGGTVTAPVTQDWSDALTALQQVDCQFVVPLVEDLTIWDMVSAHCEYMSTVAQQERRAFVGGLLDDLPMVTQPTGTVNTLLAEASLLDSPRVGLVAPGIYLSDLAGNVTLFGAEYRAAMLGAAFSALAPGETMTNKRLSELGVDVAFALPGDTDRLIPGGVTVFTPTKRGIVCAKAVTTWQGEYYYDKVEVSVGVGYDYVARTVRDDVADLIGTIGGPIGMGAVAARVDSTLRALSVPAPQGPGVLVGDANSPPYRNVHVSLAGDVCQVSFEASVGIPMNYIAVTIYAQAYSGSVTLAAAPAPSLAT